MPDIIESLRSKHPFLVSTDISGVLGNPKKAHEFWVKASGDKNIGLEFLAWLHSFKHYPEVLQGNAPLVGGFHGQVGPEEFRWKEPKDSALLLVLTHMMEANTLLLPRAQELAMQRQQQVYVLNHTPGTRQWLAQGHTKVPEGVTMLVENHVEVNSFEHAQAAIAALRERGIRSEMVFDLVHSMRSRTAEKLSYQENWQMMLDELQRAGRSLIHLPIGTKLDDSLHIDKITPEMWTQLAKIIRQNDDYIIIEHQSGKTRKNIFTDPTHKNNRELQTRAAGLVEMLRERKVLPKQTR